MRILIINDFAYVNGGAAQVALSAALGLRRAGHGVTLFAAVGPPMPDLEEAGVEVVLTGQFDILNDPNRKRAAIQGIWNVKARRMLADLLTRLDPEDTIVHVHSWTKALSSCVFRQPLQAGFSLVCTLHDYFLICPNGGLFDYQKGAVCSRVPLSPGCVFTHCDVRTYPQKVWRVVRHLVQQKIGRVPGKLSNCITISAFSESLLRPYLPESACVHFVPNPVWVAQDRQVQVDANTDFLFVGRLSKEKGGLLFAEAARRLGIKPVFVGDGDQADAIQRACPDAVITGWVGRDELAIYLDRARALVLPSLWYETQGLVVAEAAARGIPSIVSDTCAARNMVEDHTSGLWFSGGDCDDLCAKIRLLQDAGFAGKLGRQAYAAYRNNPCTLEDHIGNLLRCYEDIMADRVREGHSQGKRTSC
jgi:glycosyltransferase involved in cell wall biosynthesis